MSVSVKSRLALADGAADVSAGSVAGTCAAGLSGEDGLADACCADGAERGMQPNKRMQLAGASVLRNVGLRAIEKSPQLMRGPLGGHAHHRGVGEAQAT
jgi:hypothetical protein